MTRRLARVTTGEVWLGVEAVALGLVDGVCEDEEAALREAQQLAGLPHRRLVRMGPRRSVLQRLGVPGAGMGPPGVALDRRDRGLAPGAAGAALSHPG